MAERWAFLTELKSFILAIRGHAKQGKEVVLPDADYFLPEEQLPGVTFSPSVWKKGVKCQYCVNPDRFELELCDNNADVDSRLECYPNKIIVKEKNFCVCYRKNRSEIYRITTNEAGKREKRLLLWHPDLTLASTAHEMQELLDSHQKRMVEEWNSVKRLALQHFIEPPNYVYISSRKFSLNWTKRDGYRSYCD